MPIDRLDFAADVHGTYHIEAALTDFSLKFKNGAMVADDVLPMLKVVKEDDEYFIYGRPEQDVSDDVIAEGAEFQETRAFNVIGNPSFHCKRRGLKDRVTDKELDQHDPALDPTTDVTLGLTDKAILNRENRVATLVTDPDTYSTSGNTENVGSTAAHQWDSGSFDPTDKVYNIYGTILRAKEAVRRQIGVYPNYIVIPAAVSQVIQNSTEYMDRMKYTHGDLSTDGSIGNTFLNMKVLEPGAIKNTAALGQAFTAGDVWGKNVVLFYRSTQNAKRVMTFGLTFTYLPRQIISWRDPRMDTRQTWYGVESKMVEAITSDYCAYLLRNVIAG